MKLSELSELLPGSQRFGDDVEITSLAYDSRGVAPGCLFVALRGQQSDGHDFIAQAANSGAVAIVIDSLHAGWYSDRGLPALAVPDTRAALPSLSAAFYGEPSRSLDLIGVTGTNGKTTTTYMIESILRTLAEPVGLIGTLGALINGKNVPLERTTPESADLQRLFRAMVDQGIRHAIIEVSSEGILQRRTEQSAFDIGVFTNLSQDHLNTHGTMEAYFAEKLRLFTEYPLAFPDKQFTGVINADDPYGRRIIERMTEDGHAVLRYGRESPDVALRAEVLEVRPDGTRFQVHYQPPVGSAISFPVNLRLGGLFQVSNALAAIGVALQRRVPPTAIQNGLEALTGVPGRFELVPTGERGFTVVVDYAHTPDGLENVLRSARALNPKRLLCVFGCGGDRDPKKRPIMGRIATDLSDLAVVTSDNPRTENANSIVADILAGIEGGASNSHVVVEVDRRQAIHRALRELAQPGDLVVIAGKGHETGQQFANHKIPFDDRVVAREVLEACA